jgi:hypothetical protein
VARSFFLGSRQFSWGQEPVPAQENGLSPKAPPHVIGLDA